MTLQALLERVEAASGSDRDLDFDLEVACAPPAHAAHWQGQRVRVYEGIPADEYNTEHRDYRVKGSKDANPAPAYTASIDAAVALVEKMLPGANWRLSRWDKDDFNASIFVPQMFEAEGLKTPALALIAALLKALISQSNPERPGVE